MTRATRLRRIRLVVGALAAAERFFCDGLAFARVGGRDAADERAVVLRLGSQEIELLLPLSAGARYPPDSSAADLWFQHFAIVVADIEEACSHVAKQSGFTAISQGGPQKLPAASGGVSAFKFRDPDGHPLELLQFPAHAAPAAWRQAGSGLFLGIDHSAISVADLGRSVAFYERLGLSPGERSLNRGPEQARLDGLHEPVVDVLALHPAREPTPHLELLRYRTPQGRRLRPAPNDIAATCLVFEAEGIETSEVLADPDGHYLSVIGPAVP